MSDLEQQLLEDRLIRDAAKAVLTADIALVKGEANPAPKAKHLAESLSEKARDLSEETLELAFANKGKIGGGLVFVLLAALAWFFRDQLAGLIRSFRETDKEP